MLQRLRKLFGGVARDEARHAITVADKQFVDAETRAVEVAGIVDRLNEHGRRNHFGERIEAAYRRA